MKRLILTAFLFSIAFISFSQCPSAWFNGVGAPPNGSSAQSFASLAYSNGKIFLSNQMSLADTLVSGNISVDTDPSMIFPKVQYLVAMDTLGTTEWMISIGCQLFMTNETSMVSDDIGNTYLFMSFPGDLYLPDTVLTTDNGNCMVTKFDVEGNRVWTKQLEGSGIPRSVWCNGKLVFVLGYQNQIELLGTEYISDGEFDFLIIWMNTEGGVEQVKEIKGDGEATVWALSCIGQDLLVQGRFNQEFEYPGISLGTSGENQSRSYQLFLNPQGGLLWNTQSTFHIGGGWIQESATQVGSQIISVGRHGTEGIMFDNLTIPHFGGGDGYICGQNMSDGSFNWLKGFGSTASEYLMKVSRYGNNLLISGQSTSAEVIFDGGQFENQFPGVRQPILFVVDTTGKFVCKKEIESDSELGELDEAMSVGSDIYATVNYATVRPLDDFTTTLVGQRNLGVWKTCLPCDTLTSIAEAENGQPRLNLYPNPASTQTQLNYRSPQGTRPKLQLRDMLGRTVQTIQLPSHEGTYILDAASLGTGIYFCSLLSGAEVLATQKLSVLKK
ncbi:MAG: T9SS type A sorting domain-containing protein [Flavobacteriales bacterium]|nr:T9SS type A sorting domain-containing protein [Flavobacteriales bacterium]